MDEPSLSPCRVPPAGQFEGVILAMSHPTVFIGASLGYLFACLLLWRAMALRKPVGAGCQFWMRLYNLVQVVFNAYLVSRMYRTHLPPNIFGINATYTADIRFSIFLHYMSKYLDFFDTFFIILRKKDSQLSFLHLYHHATIGVVWGYLLHIGHGNGTSSFGAFINSAVHLLMYSHYLVTSFGLRNPFKAAVTKTQIGQFYLCLVHVVAALRWEICVPLSLKFLQCAYHISMVLLFSHFYRKSFGKAIDAKDGNGKHL